ncbi:MAG: GGDEF domain-containing protein [Acidimicrobiales bacterium]
MAGWRSLEPRWHRTLHRNRRRPSRPADRRVNRLGWTKAVTRRESSDTDEPVALFMFDLNDLKQVNDRRGHHVGDQHLIAAAQCLQSLFRSTDTVARIGGDEFAALVPGGDERWCRQRLAELRSAEAFRTRRPQE